MVSLDKKERIMMNRDNITHEVWQCAKCRSIWEDHSIGKVAIEGIDKMFCRTCGCEDLRRVGDED